MRDTLLGRVRDELDLDMTTDASPDEVEALLRRAKPTAVWTQGKKFGTIGATLVGPNGPRAYEITTHRADAYSPDSRKPEVAFAREISDDLSRRDFTVNSIAFDLAQHTLIDPFHGAEDLKQRILRTPRSPEESFSDDPLRMLRAARFIAGYDLAPDDGLWMAVGAMHERLRIVSAERIRDELVKLLAVDEPDAGLAFLFASGLADEFIPEVTPHEKTVRERLPNAFDMNARDMNAHRRGEYRLVTLFFDLGAATTRKRMRALKFSLEETEFVSGVIELLHAVVEFDKKRNDGQTADDQTADAETADGQTADAETADAETADGWTAPTLRRFAYRAGPLLPTTRELLANFFPDRSERFETVFVPLSETENMLNIEAELDGEAVMGLLNIPTGPEVGRALKMLLELRFDEGVVGRDAAEQRLLEWAKP